MGVAGSMGDGGVSLSGGWVADHRREGLGSCHRQSPGSCLRATNTTTLHPAVSCSLPSLAVVIAYVLVP
ncbi:hypothetical protein E2C01_003996 [Portunus trituberculatus]|uniref:Uncharacterized protein n=2 Tax=Portuninae TaxID=600346 RepID=A0A5B7CV67_PORTR|nr:hypothetical protein [Portunus trituberculatus]